MLECAVAELQAEIQANGGYDHDRALDVYLAIACRRQSQAMVAWDARMSYERAKLDVRVAKLAGAENLPEHKAAAQHAKLVLLAIERRAELEGTFCDRLEETFPGLAPPPLTSWT
jgi:hypothetical protein